ncbi:MAG: SUMF1/EgtB/PvdO family nonheme iron enzyme [Myxococcota bacterium]|nr:SUMF1/EgtB/PvdO family nonheme iron enzyme [Myxococcota bacterium]
MLVRRPLLLVLCSLVLASCSQGPTAEQPSIHRGGGAGALSPGSPGDPALQQEPPALDEQDDSLGQGRQRLTFESVLGSIKPVPRPANQACPEGMVQVPAGVYPIGDGDGKPPGEPVLRVPPLAETRAALPSFCMDRFEFPNQAGAYPLVRVSWHEAEQLCRKQGKRLCGEHEWEAACRGPEGHRYAYGPARRSDTCNTEIGEFEESIVTPLRPNDPAGSCTNWLGIHNLNGNVSEWVAELYTGPSYPELTGAPEPPGVPRHVLRGGAPWPAFYGQDCLSRHWHSSGYDRGDDDGFRCCAGPQPPEAQRENESGKAVPEAIP